MIFAYHNFVDNYASADARNDDFMKKTIIVDEIARVITNNKIQLVKLLRSNGVNATYNDTSKRLLELTLMLISQNEGFIFDLKNLIVQNHKQGAVASANGKFISDELASKDASKGVMATIKSIHNDRLNATGIGYANADDVLRDRVTLADSMVNNKPISKKQKYIIIAASAIVLITIGVLLYRKFRASNANNGSVNPQIGTPVTDNYDSGNDSDEIE